MNTYLFFDTETTGLPKDYKAHYSDVDNFPRLVQLAWIIYQEEKEVSFSDFLIIPDGFEIPEAASDIHGFKTDVCKHFGYDLKKVLNKFCADFAVCNCLVAHNASFDKNIVSSELYRGGADKHAKLIHDHKTVCTMMKSIKHCNLLGKYGLKFPKLQELHETLFGCGFEDAHNALNDIRATAKCFFEMKRLNLIGE